MKPELRSSLREFVLIALSVLLAFAIESQWSASRDRVEDAAYMAGLVAELGENRIAIAAAGEAAAQSVAAVDTLRMVWSEVIEPASISIPQLIWRATSVSQVQISFVAFESLTSGPAWARAGTAELQVVLSSLAGNLSQLNGTTEQTSEYWFESFEPALRETISYDDWGAAFLDPSSVGNPTEWEGLLERRDIQNLVTHTAWFSSLLANQSAVALEGIDEAVELIEARSP